MAGIPRIMGYPSVEDDVEVPFRRPEPAPAPQAPAPQTPGFELPPALAQALASGRTPRSYEDLMPPPKDTSNMDRMLALGGRLGDISAALGQNKVAGGGQEFAGQLASIGQKQKAAEQAYAKDKLAFDTGEQERVMKLALTDQAKAAEKQQADQLRAFYASKGVQIPEGMSMAGLKELNPSLIPKPPEAPKPMTPLEMAQLGEIQARTAKTRAETAGVGQKPQKFDIHSLPLEAQLKIKPLVETQVKREKSMQDFDAALMQFDNAKPGDKVRIGQGLLKLLNSPDNPDAVGKEEAERIGSELMLWSMNDPDTVVRLGRNLEGFRNRVQQKRNIIADAHKTAQAQVDQILGKPATAPPQTPSQPPQAGAVEDGHRFKGGNPADPANWEAIQ